jgi:hypothetical protein
MTLLEAPVVPPAAASARKIVDAITAIATARPFLHHHLSVKSMSILLVAIPQTTQSGFEI